MKRLFFIPLMLIVSFAMATACSDAPIPAGEDQTAHEENTGSDGNEGTEGENEGGNMGSADGRCLVLYCSRTGNTERMAQTISSTLECDIMEVVPSTPYEEDYNAMLDRAQAELDDIARGNYPAIATAVESFDDYDFIFVGYPIWFGHMATPMQAFLYNHAGLLAGKHIALFASSGSSGIGTSERDAAALVQDAVFEESLLLTSGSIGSMDTRILAWLEELGLLF